MNGFTLEITKEHAGNTVGQIIQHNFKISSRLLTKLKNHDGIKLNGEHITVRGIVKAGDVLTITMPPETSPNVIPVNIPLNIIYEDEELLILNKPGNMPVHPSMNNFDNSLGNGVMYYYRNIPFVYRPVNRLDRDTTGIVVVAKSAYSGNLLSTQMMKKTIKKTYLAVLDGVPSPTDGIINAPIKREHESIIKRIVSDDGQQAVTEYSVIKEENGRSLVRINLHTGRTHQIRVHFAHIGTPLLYDFLYGNEVKGKTFLLHCCKLEFTHPISKERMTVVCPPDSEFYNELK